MEEGRPTKYDPKFNKQIEKLCKLGATDKEIADFFEVSESTLNLWKKEHTKFSESIQKGKILADANVSERLYSRATGYSHPDIDIRVIEGDIVQTQIIKHYPPDTGAAIFWLKNRRKKQWRDKIEQGFTDENGNDINPIHIFKLPDNGRDETKADTDH